MARTASAEIARVVGDDRVSERTSDRAAYSRDLWPRDLLGVREGLLPPGPEIVAWPGSVEEVSRLLVLAKKRGLTVVPYGGGAGVCGAARIVPPSEDGAAVAKGTLLLDLKRLRKIRLLDGGARLAEIESGIVGEVMERALNHRGFTLGHFPSSIYCSTLGGFIAARSAGQLSSRYGKIEDMVVGLEAVLPDGEVVRLDEGMLARGPELSQLLIGSEGTLGVCTAATLRVHPLAETQILRAWSFHGVEAGLEAVRAMLQAGLRPAVVRLYDELDTMLALSGGSRSRKLAPPGLAALLSPKALAGEVFGFFPSVGKEALALLLKQPKVLNRVAGVVGERCLLVLMFEGPKEGTAIEAAEAERLLRALGGRDLGAAPAERWKQKRYAVSYRQSKVFAAGAFNDTAEVAATWEALPRLYRDVKAAIARHAFVMAHFSHAYPEGCSIYFTFVGYGRNAAESRRVYDAVWADLLAATHEAGGTISHHHGVGLSKARFLPDELGAGGMEALRLVKHALDPDERFNPGKLGLAGDDGNVRVRAPAAAAARRRRRPRAGVSDARRLAADLAALLDEERLARGGAAASFLGMAPPRGADPMIASPGTMMEVEQVLAAARASAAPVLVAGTSGRGVDWGRLPKGASVVLDVTRLDALLALDETSLTVTVQSGIGVATLERALLRRGFTLGFHLGGFAERVSVGGILATGLPPIASPLRGTPADHVVGVGWVLPGGTRVRGKLTPRSATGPDPDALVLGARGALGVITEATLRIYRLSEERQLLGFGFRSLAEAIAALSVLVDRGLAPTSAGIWPAGAGAKRGARLAAQFSGTADWTKAMVAAARKLLRDAGARPDPKPDESWFAHADAAAARVGGEHEPIWAYGSWAALARAATAAALAGPDAAFGLPCFDRHGGYAVAATGPGSESRARALVDAGCRLLSGPSRFAEPFDEPHRRLLRTLGAVVDPPGLFNPGALDV